MPSFLQQQGLLQPAWICPDKNGELAHRPPAGWMLRPCGQGTESGTLSAVHLSSPDEVPQGGNPRQVATKSSTPRPCFKTYAQTAAVRLFSALDPRTFRWKVSACLKGHEVK